MREVGVNSAVHRTSASNAPVIDAAGALHLDEDPVLRRAPEIRTGTTPSTAAPLSCCRVRRRCRASRCRSRPSAPSLTDARAQRPSVAAQEHRVARHPHVELEILHRLAIRIVDSKREQWSGASPRAACRRAPTRCVPITGIGVVASRTRRCHRPTAASPCNPLVSTRRVTVSDTPVAWTRSANSSYLPGRQLRQTAVRTSPVALSSGMQMPQAIERRRHHEQMHRVTVIGNEVVEPAAADPSGIAQRQAAASRRR